MTLTRTERIINFIWWAILAPAITIGSWYGIYKLCVILLAAL